MNGPHPGSRFAPVCLLVVLLAGCALLRKEPPREPVSGSTESAAPVIQHAGSTDGAPLATRTSSAAAPVNATAPMSATAPVNTTAAADAASYRSQVVGAAKEKPPSGAPGGARTTRSAPGAAGMSGATGNGATAQESADGSDDDIVARRLRKAAEQETDPVLRKKLWAEYLSYRSNVHGG